MPSGRSTRGRAAADGRRVGDASVRQNLGGGGFSAFLTSLAPANPIRAAAEDAILGIVVFAIVFGFATTRLSARLRQPL
jgi:proton glutamate symport protein